MAPEKTVEHKRLKFDIFFQPQGWQYKYIDFYLVSGIQVLYCLYLVWNITWTE